MTPPMFVLYVTFLLLVRSGDMTALKSSSSLRFLSVNFGEDVTLECFYEEGAVAMLYWYKQTPGQRPQLVSKVYKHGNDAAFSDEFENDTRFTLVTNPGENHLKITHAQISDSGTYYCLSSYAYRFNFIDGIIVHVKGSGLNIPAVVHQSGSETVQPGGSETLNCTVHTGSCDGEHSVYWFRNSQESHPGLIYTHGGSNDQCEREANTQTHSCVYNLPLKSLNVSHAGTYYCAVASCGHILFGNGTTLDFEEEVDSNVLVYVLSGALAFTSILVVLLAYKAYTLFKTNRCRCTESQARSSAAPNVEGYQDAEDLHYAALRAKKASRSTRQQRDDSRNECVYSSVRQ